VRGVAGRVHSGANLGETRIYRPYFGMGVVPGGDTLGPPLHSDGRGYWWPAQDTGAQATIKVGG
jgi:hypothetical protein